MSGFFGWLDGSRLPFLKINHMDKRQFLKAGACMLSFPMAKHLTLDATPYFPGQEMEFTWFVLKEAKKRLEAGNPAWDNVWHSDIENFKDLMTNGNSS